MGDFKLDNFDTFTRAVDNLYVTKEACNVTMVSCMAQCMFALVPCIARRMDTMETYMALHVINKKPYLARHRN